MNSEEGSKCSWCCLRIEISRFRLKFWDSQLSLSHPNFARIQFPLFRFRIQRASPRLVLVRNHNFGNFSIIVSKLLASAVCFVAFNLQVRRVPRCSFARCYLPSTMFTCHGLSFPSFLCCSTFPWLDCRAEIGKSNLRNTN